MKGGVGIRGGVRVHWIWGKIEGDCFRSNWGVAMVFGVEIRCMSTALYKHRDSIGSSREDCGENESCWFVKSVGFLGGVSD